MNRYKSSFLIISNDIESQKLYETILEAEGFTKFSSCSFNDIDPSLADDIYIVDIVHLSELKIIEETFSKKHKNVVLISPFAQNEQAVESNHFIPLSKPLQFKKFISLLKALASNLAKTKFLETRQGLFGEALEMSPTRIAIFRNDGRLIYANAAYLEANKIRSLETEYFFEDMPNCRLTFTDVLHRLVKSDRFVIERQEDHRWYKSEFFSIENKEYVVHQCNDTTDIKSDIEILSREALFFRHTNEGVIITDNQGTILSINTAFCKITGYTHEEAIGKSTHILSSGIHTPEFYQNMWDSLKYNDAWQGEIWNRRKNGEVYPEWLSISAAVDPKTGEKNYLALFTDISSLKETDKKLHFYANHDHLTGLLNRTQFENMLSRAIKSAQRSEKKFALMFMDIDHFKEVNDTYGHSVGDLLLKKIATTLQKLLRSKDIIARIGGDEFNVLLEDIEDESDILAIANKLTDALREPIIIDGHSCFISLSVGVALYPLHGLDGDTLGKNADAAMYEVKKRGRDGVMLYDENFTNKLLRRVSLQNDLKQALLNRELEVYFQPVVDSNSMKVSKAEALVRWNHPKKGFISPEEFIPIAEQHGMIMDLGRAVMEHCFVFLPRVLAEVEGFKLAINISARELFDDNYLKNFFELVDDFGVDLKHIELEITETHVMKNHNEAIEKFKILKARGASLAIDDFGTGYSSLSYLKNFPIDKLKVDKSFVLGSLSDSGDRSITESIIGLAKTFNLTVQAEGVETEAHRDLLLSMGCDYLQGYYYAKALSENDFLEYLKDFNFAQESNHA